MIEVVARLLREQDELLFSIATNPSRLKTPQLELQSVTGMLIECYQLLPPSEVDRCWDTILEDTFDTLSQRWAKRWSKSDDQLVLDAMWHQLVLPLQRYLNGYAIFNAGFEAQDAVETDYQCVEKLLPQQHMTNWQLKPLQIAERYRSDCVAVEFSAWGKRTVEAYRRLRVGDPIDYTALLDALKNINGHGRVAEAYAGHRLVEFLYLILRSLSTPALVTRFYEGMVKTVLPVWFVGRRNIATLRLHFEALQYTWVCRRNAFVEQDHAQETTLAIMVLQLLQELIRQCEACPAALGSPPIMASAAAAFAFPSSSSSSSSSSDDDEEDSVVKVPPEDTPAAPRMEPEDDHDMSWMEQEEDPPSSTSVVLTDDHILGYGKYLWSVIRQRKMPAKEFKALLAEAGQPEQWLTHKGNNIRQSGVAYAPYTLAGLHAIRAALECEPYVPVVKPTPPSAALKKPKPAPKPANKVPRPRRKRVRRDLSTPVPVTDDSDDSDDDEEEEDEEEDGEDVLRHKAVEQAIVPVQQLGIVLTNNPTHETLQALMAGRKITQTPMSMPGMTNKARTGEHHQLSLSATDCLQLQAGAAADPVVTYAQLIEATLKQVPSIEVIGVETPHWLGGCFACKKSTSELVALSMAVLTRDVCYTDSKKINLQHTVLDLPTSVFQFNGAKSTQDTKAVQTFVVIPVSLLGSQVPAYILVAKAGVAVKDVRLGVVPIALALNHHLVHVLNDGTTLDVDHDQLYKKTVEILGTHVQVDAAPTPTPALHRGSVNGKTATTACREILGFGARHWTSFSHSAGCEAAEARVVRLATCQAVQVLDEACHKLQAVQVLDEARHKLPAVQLITLSMALDRVRVQPVVQGYLSTIVCTYLSLVVNSHRSVHERYNYRQCYTHWLAPRLMPFLRHNIPCILQRLQTLRPGMEADLRAMQDNLQRLTAENAALKLAQLTAPAASLLVEEDSLLAPRV